MIENLHIVASNYLDIKDSFELDFDNITIEARKFSTLHFVGFTCQSYEISKTRSSHYNLFCEEKSMLPDFSNAKSQVSYFTSQLHRTTLTFY